MIGNGDRALDTILIYLFIIVSAMCVGFANKSSLWGLAIFFGLMSIVTTIGCVGIYIEKKIEEAIEEFQRNQNNPSE